jgi:hypothetical protein
MIDPMAKINPRQNLSIPAFSPGPGECVRPRLAGVCASFPRVAPPVSQAWCPHPASTPSSPPRRLAWCPAGSCVAPPSTPSRRGGEGRGRQCRPSPLRSTRVRCRRPARPQRPLRYPSGSCAAPPSASGRRGGEGRDLRQTTSLGISFPSRDLRIYTKTTNSESDIL